MESWVPLFVAIVGAIAAIGVAFWNSRGESAELRQLKAMNEVLAGMSPSAERETLEAARNALVRRVARWVQTAPLRRRQAVVLSIGVVSFAVGIVVLVVAWPGAVALGWESAVLTIGSAIVAAAVTVAIGISEGVFEKMGRLIQDRRKPDPGGGRSA